MGMSSDPSAAAILCFVDRATKCLVCIDMSPTNAADSLVDAEADVCSFGGVGLERRQAWRSSVPFDLRVKPRDCAAFDALGR